MKKMKKKKTNGRKNQCGTCGEFHTAKLTCLKAWLMLSSSGEKAKQAEAR